MQAMANVRFQMFFTHVTIILLSGDYSDPQLKQMCACLSFAKQNCKFLKVRSTFGFIMFCGIKKNVGGYLEIY